MILDLISRGWENFVARLNGPLDFRFILQPTVGVILAVRAGLKDAREGRPAFLWAAFFDAADRKRLLRSGLTDTRNILLIAVILDAIYQIIAHQTIYPLELLFTTVLLALVPYLVLRGPVNRIARWFISDHRGTRTSDGDSKA